MPPAKRKRVDTNRKAGKKKAEVPKRGRAAAFVAPADEDLVSEDDEGNDAAEESEEEEQEEEETADEKRLRLARAYLTQLQDEQEDKSEDDEEDDEEEDGVQKRLTKDTLLMQGKTYKYIADDVADIGEEAVGRVLRGHRLPVTCTAISGDEKWAYSGSKDSAICQYDVETGKMVHKWPGDKQGLSGHKGHVLSLAVTDDGQYLASGGEDSMINIWDSRTRKMVDGLKGHRDSVCSMAFQIGTHQLYSASKDRTVKLWDVDKMGYMETLYGHALPIASVHVLKKERAVSVGEDRTLRVWKISEESQLILRGHSASIDCVCMLDEQTYFSGSQDGSLCLWSIMKKKPAHTIQEAHGASMPWLSAVAACSFTDLLASGSSDGHVRFWKAKNNRLSAVGSVPVPGVGNALSFGASGRVLVCGGGQEHRLGRWERHPEGKNGIRIVQLPIKDRD